MDTVLTQQTIEIALSAFVAPLPKVAVEYDDVTDVLYFRRYNIRPAGVSHHLDDGLYIKYTPDTHEVIGGHIEDFVSDYLLSHPQLGEAWESFRQRHRPASLLAELERLLQTYVGKIVREEALGLHLKMV